jgi:quinol monooxygenase YgiN
MRTVMVRYKLKAGRADENEQLVRAVFAQLARDKPARVRYEVFRLPDGLTYVHVASSEAEVNPMTRLEAFKAYTAAIQDRCEEPPVQLLLQAVARYDGLA